MLKKQVALFFILLANIILLAHAAVPHHHHKTQVCIVSTHCQNDSKPQNTTNTEHNHQHDGGNGSNYCLLKQGAILPSSQAKQECECFVLPDGNSPLDAYQAIFPDNEFPCFKLKSINNTDVPLRTSLFIVYVISSTGLRAPPSV